MNLPRILFNYLFIFIPFYSVYAQDTLRITLYQADSIFLKNNLQLLASSMNIEAHRAQVIQSRLYPNPIFSADINAYDPENNKLFHVGNSGQKVFQLEQLFLLGGKRKSQIELAKTNVKIAEIEFQQLLRELKFRLRSDLFSLGLMPELIRRHNEQLYLLETLLNSYETQSAKGNLPLKDVVRLKGAYLKLNNDRAEILKEYFELQGSLQTLLHTSALIQFEFTEADIQKYIQIKTIDELKEMALANRPELEWIRTNKTLAEQYLRYQKQLAIPDINVFTAYDQRGGAFNNQVNAGISVPLPVWNRNKGNISESRFRIKETEYQLQALENEVISKLQNAHLLYTQNLSEYQKATRLYNQDFEVTINGMTTNFQKRNINIVEFIDFFESYNEALTELARIKSELVISAEQINLLTGKDIY